ncbi:dd-gdca protein [Anaeramoeba flamelloides]|uniref:Dd-gdca protein n=1 Tax=Anaeramoeba flamelloides TaxID=1746091 RepID=A0AAV7ZS52_9EUKA|nr:dd-gdca protein [Anaeramoeba flamelloides]
MKNLYFLCSLFFFICLCEVKIPFPPLNQCVQKGNPGQSCGRNSDCFDGLWCDTNGICQKDNTYETCLLNKECMGRLCLDGVCVGKKENGFDCHLDEECIGRYCIDNKCHGTKEGSYCTYYNQNTCDTDLYCRISCLPILQPGDICTYRPNTINQNSGCSPGYICGYSTYVYETNFRCVAAFSKNTGENCLSNEECKYGLSCVSFFCRENNPPACMDDSGCSVDSYCYCDPKSKEKFCVSNANKECQSYYTDLQECLIKNKCQLHQYPSLPNQCSSTHCYQEILNLECCKQKGFESSYFLPNKMNCSHATTPTPTPTLTPKPTSTITNKNHGKPSNTISLTLAIIIPISIFVICLLIFFLVVKNRNKRKRKIY